MIFKTNPSKFGKGEYVSAYMPSKSQILIYYNNGGVLLKKVDISKTGLSLTKENISFPYSQIIPINNSYLVARIDKSIGIIKNEK